MVFHQEGKQDLTSGFGPIAAEAACCARGIGKHSDGEAENRSEKASFEMSGAAALAAVQSLLGHRK